MRSGRVALAALLLLTSACSAGGVSDDDPLAVGRQVYSDLCTACHGPNGEGGVGPALAGVRDTFPACQDHVRWVELGSLGWKDEVGPTYGATGKPVAGAMPGFATTLTPEEILSVVQFERVRYGGADAGATASECGGG